MKIAASTLVLALSTSLVTGLEERQFLSDVTSVAGAAFSDVTSIGAGIFSTVTSDVANAATSVIPNEFSTVTSGGKAPPPPALREEKLRIGGW